MRKWWRASSALLFWDLQDTTEALDIAVAAPAMDRYAPASKTSFPDSNLSFLSGWGLGTRLSYDRSEVNYNESNRGTARCRGTYQRR